MQQRAVLKGYSQPVIARLLEELSCVDLINDTKLARTLAEGELMRKPAAAPLLLHKLARRGVDEDLAEHAASAALRGRDTLQDAIALIEAKAQRAARAVDLLALRRRLFGLLARRGFDEETALRALDRTMGPAPESLD
jgi:regulatory protein